MAETSVRIFFHKLPRAVSEIFRRYYPLQLLAAALTWLAVASGFDWRYFSSTRSPVLRAATFPAVMIGGLLPIVLPLALYAIGIMVKNLKTVAVAGAIGQAAMLGLLISSFYKALTGRVPPRFGGVTTVDVSRMFRFGFLRGGIFWGWPSSHATVAFAMAVALATLYPKNKTVWTLSLLYAFYVGVGVSMTIHWFSDFAAGAIIGAVIGAAVGANFRRMLYFSHA